MRCVLLLVLCLGLAAARSKQSKYDHDVKKRQVHRPCNADEFQCKNGRCIQSEWTCDSDNDCLDNSDETLPECPSHGQCTGPHEVLCDNHKCISIEFRCDGKDDCHDGTDERRCQDFECTGGEWKCENGHCIEWDWICDGDNDCVDGSDEKSSNCHLKTTAVPGR